MKKNILLIAALALLAFGFTSCEKKSAGHTSITYYAEIVLEGGDMILAKGSTYVEPGYSAIMAGKDVTDQVKVDGAVNTAASGVYVLTYSMVNADGFASSASRTVVVLDPADPIEGYWACDPASFRLNANTGAEVAYGYPFEILILSDPRGVYYVDDLLAGWYCQRAGYGTNYAMQAYIGVAADGAISLLQSYVPGWGDTADALDDGLFDPAKGTISYKLTYAGYLIFNVTLYKVDLGL